MLVNILPNLC